MTTITLSYGRLLGHRIGRIDKMECTISFVGQEIGRKKDKIGTTTVTYEAFDSKIRYKVIHILNETRYIIIRLFEEVKP